MAGIFKSYDIRGKTPVDLNTGKAYQIGRAIAVFLGATNGGKIVVGRDMRTESPDLAAALMAGMNSVGTHTDFLGLCDTPMTFYSAGKLDCNGSAMITASHNPAGWDGIKITGKGGKPVSYDTGINTIEDMVKNDEPRLDKDITPGKMTPIDIKPEYYKHVRNFLGNVQPKKCKVVIDTGNGVMGPQIEGLLKGLPVEVVELFFKPDGTFPNHEANPLKLENLVDCQNAVKKTGADFGVCFDGDADRLAFIDDNGDVIPCDQIVALFAVEYLKQKPGAHILFDLRSSIAVGEVIKENGGTWELCRVGHSHIKKAMRESNAVFAGELSGHYYFSENYNCDSGAIALMFALRMLSSTGKKLSELRKGVSRYWQSGEINFEVHDTAAVMKRLEETYGKKAKDILRIDGLRFDMGSWWFNVRPSNTEPIVRLNLESLTSKEECAKKKDEVVKIIMG